MQVHKRILAAVVLGVGLLVAAPGVAGASGETVGGCILEEFEELFGEEIPAELTEEQDEALEEIADECNEAPSPVIPEVNEIIWGGLFFAIVLGVLAKFAFPALKQGMQQREDKIRDDLEAAEQSRAEAEQELARYRQQLADARQEAAQIVEEAREAGDQVRRDIIARAEEDASALRSRAEEDVRLATERAMADLQSQVGSLSIDLAEKIVERNLDRDTQMALIQSYIDQVGSGS